MSLQLVRVIDHLPTDFPALQAEAEREGHRNLTRLAQEWSADPTEFVALLAAFYDGRLVGIGGMTREPDSSDEPTLRMRRLYVSPQARRQGMARVIANALLQEAFDQSALVTVHAGNAGAAAFWMAMGFAPAEGRNWSHERRPH
ncbi:MAG TPA: GNAT family N-acetyltransferase [Phenylobacterium sp.]|jgi:GNAT superfamily N-acetyltransferase|uniref:GNAT family N-acetyltransferase n=1 Tax=Phenylobacterium sp. TaxID=1871053 RepID=UPI002D277F4A|nr:GNAT family N-acetyltransferase [Phenylobacterium sp.]HZZ68259.1 GNAT family N-acetyltransferase [Phenylobacterium sp.]